MWVPFFLKPNKRFKDDAIFEKHSVIVLYVVVVIDKSRILTSDVKFKVCGHWYALVVVYSLTTEREIEF